MYMLLIKSYPYLKGFFGSTQMQMRPTTRKERNKPFAPNEVCHSSLEGRTCRWRHVEHKNAFKRCPSVPYEAALSLPNELSFGSIAAFVSFISRGGVLDQIWQREILSGPNVNNVRNDLSLKC